MFPTRLKGNIDRQKLVDHLISLREGDRYLRFGYKIRDEQIAKYVERSFDLEQSQWFGVFDDDDNVIASLHVIMVTSKKAEMGCTVDVDHRGNGIGQLLFTRGVSAARAAGARQIFMQCLSENKIIQHIAKKNKMLVATVCPTEQEAKLEFPTVDYVAPYNDIMFDRIAAVDAVFRQQRNIFKSVINAWTKPFKGKMQ